MEMFLESGTEDTARRADLLGTRAYMTLVVDFALHHHDRAHTRGSEAGRLTL